MPYHWNLDGIAAHNFGKLYLVDSHALIYSTDITFLAATFLDSSIENTINLILLDVIYCIYCLLIIHEIPKEEVSVCIIKTNYQTLDVMTLAL